MNKNQEVLNVLNNLEVIEKQGGEDSYILVANNIENQKALNVVGISSETINQYGDEDTFCIFALSFGEGYANWIEDGKPAYKDEAITEHLKNEISLLLDAPINDFGIFHEHIQQVLNRY